MTTIVSETKIGSYGSYTTEYAWLEGTELSRTDTSVTVRYTIYFKLAGSQTVFNDPIVATLTVNGVTQTTIEVKPETSGQLYGNDGSMTWSVSQEVTTYNLTTASCDIPVVCVYEDQLAPSNFSPKTISGNMPVSSYYVEENDVSISGRIQTPESKDILITIYKNGEYYTSFTETASILNPAWGLGGLQRYKNLDTGEENIYTVEYPDIEGWNKELSNNGFNVVYSWIQVYTESLSGNITYPGTVKDITVTLYKNGVYEDSKVVNTTSYSFTGLPKYKDLYTGMSNSYTVEFSQPTEWSKSVVGNNVVYSWIQVYTSISGSITWSDSSNQSITVTLTGGASTQTTTGTNSYSFTDLPIYSNLSNGDKYVYEVSFPNVDNYKVLSNGNNATYTLVTTVIRVTGGWYDNDNALGIRPDKITYILYQDGIVFDEIEKNNNELSYDFTAPIGHEYTVHVKPVEGYLGGADYRTTTGFWHADWFPKVDIHGSIEWNDDSNSDEIRPSTYEVILLKNGVECASAQTINSNVTHFSFNDQWYYNSWEDYNVAQYEIKITPIDGYDINYQVDSSYFESNSSFKITLKHVPENKSYIFTKGEWKEVETYVYTKGAWQPVKPNVL